LPAAIDISTLALFSSSETRLGESQYTQSTVIERWIGEIALRRQHPPAPLAKRIGGRRDQAEFMAAFPELNRPLATGERMAAFTT